jgi:DnaJ family protein C protein 11
MSRSADSKLAAERGKNGLIILEANYGLASAFTDKGIQHPDEDEHGGPMIIDVTVPLQVLVQDSRVTIPGGRGKYDLLGFYDPCIGEGKKLRIKYMFKDVLHEVTVGDRDSLRIPMKGKSAILWRSVFSLMIFRPRARINVIVHCMHPAHLSHQLAPKHG